MARSKNFEITGSMKTSVKKATGRDDISAKLLKLAKPVIAKPITKMINKTITHSVLPDQLKQVQVAALVLFICLCTNSSDISLNSRLGISFLFLLISMILG
jgi:hypothetical protein